MRDRLGSSIRIDEAVQPIQGMIRNVKERVLLGKRMKRPQNKCQLVNYISVIEQRKSAAGFDGREKIVPSISPFPT